jgi:hypothetical protein
VTPIARRPCRPGSRAGAAGALAAVALVAVLAGCGGSASPGAGASSSASGSGPADARPSGTTPAGQPAVELTIQVHGSTVTPAPASVDVPVNRPVRLTVTADRTTRVHVHVVDIEKPVTAGKAATIDFTPTQQGVYEVELHDPDLLLVKLAVR